MANPEAKARNKVAAPQRAAASVDRATALRQKLANAEPGFTQEDLAASASRQVTRQALAFARATFDQAVADRSQELAQAMIERALTGDSNMLIALLRTASPPARYDSTKIQLDVARIETPADVDAARRRLAMAVFRGEVGVEDGAALGKLLDGISEASVKAERAALLHDMRRGLADTAKGGVATQIRLMTQRAELLLSAGNGAARAGTPPVIEAVVDDDPDPEPEDWRDLL